MPEAAVDWGSVGPLCLTSLAIMGSPGPATLSLVASASAYGVRGSIPYAAGIAAGTMLVLLAVASGITAALLAIPALGSVLVALSAAYIVWLAYRVATAPPLSAQTGAAIAPSLAGGTFLGVANPKAWVAIAAVFASTHLDDAATSDALAKTAVLTAMIVVIMAGWLAAGAALAPMFRQPRRARMVNVTLALALVVTTGLAVVHP